MSYVNALLLLWLIREVRLSRRSIVQVNIAEVGDEPVVVERNPITFGGKTWVN